MIKSRKIKVEYEKIIMAMTMTKTITTKTIITTMIIMRIKIGNQIKIWKR